MVGEGLAATQGCGGRDAAGGKSLVLAAASGTDQGFPRSQASPCHFAPKPLSAVWAAWSGETAITCCR